MNELHSVLIPKHKQIPFFREMTEKDISLELKIPISKRSYWGRYEAELGNTLDPRLGHLFLEGILESYTMKLLLLSNRTR